MRHYSAEELQSLCSAIRQNIDDYCLREFKQERRTHLGASEIGEECLRRLWYLWRWIRNKQFEARMLRLFNRGHLEEKRYLQWLRGGGFTVWEINPHTGEQYLFSDIGGHYGGSTDGLAVHDYFPGELLICEFKTHNDKLFKQLLKSGVQIAQPKHFAQMSNYGARFGARLGIYCAANKNDDALHMEIVVLDHNMAAQMTEKARYIITSPKPPPRMSGASIVHWQCKLCESRDVCFQRAPADRNCRSCEHASPADNAEWYCALYQGNIPKDFIPKGCPNYRPIV
jgi:ribosomal protein S27E